MFENNGIIDPKFELSLNIFFKFETHFFLCNSVSSIEPAQEKKKISDEMLNRAPITYTVNTIKIEYLPVGKPRGANILTLLVWR